TLGVDAAAFATRAGDGGGAGLRAAPPAGRAALLLRNRDADLRAVDGLVEAEADFGFEVASAQLLGLGPAPRSAAAEDPPGASAGPRASWGRSSRRPGRRTRPPLCRAPRIARGR